MTKLAHSSDVTEPRVEQTTGDQSAAPVSFTPGPWHVYEGQNDEVFRTSRTVCRKIPASFTIASVTSMVCAIMIIVAAISIFG